MRDPAGRPIAAAAALCSVTLLIAFFLLGAGAGWSTGVAGGGDAWQNLWNFHHIDASLREGTSVYRTHALWYPEGAGLGAHCQSLSLSVPGALLGRVIGFRTAYNVTVLLSFVLAALGMFRLSLRLGVGRSGAFASALCFAFAPPRVARAYGHLNLVGLGFLPFALEGLVAASRSRGRARVPGAVEAAVSLAALAYCDYYLAVLGAIACASLGAFELLRAPRGERRSRLAVLAAVALLSLGLALPQLRATLRDAGAVATGHESKWCSVALTSLFVPSRIQVASVLTRALTERNHQNLVEGVGYLGLVPVLATLAVAFRRRSREMDFALVAGAIALVVSLGPRLRVFDRLLDVPLPYAALEAWAPALRLGGCVNRFEQLAFLPLALGLGFWIDRGSRRRSAGAFTVAALALCAFEYAPWRIPIEAWPMNPPDPAIRALAEARGGAVLDVDMGIGALVRQMAHGRPITFGYLSRTPTAQDEARRADPAVGPLVVLDGQTDLPPASVAAILDYRWGVTHVVVPATAGWKAHATSFGLTELAASDRTFVFLPSASRLAPVQTVLAQDVGKASLRGAGVGSWGLEPYSSATWSSHSYAGCWTAAEAGFVLPADPGRYVIRLESPPGSTISHVSITWGARRRRVEFLLHGEREVPIDVAESDLSRTGWLGLTLVASTVPDPSGERARGVLFDGLFRVRPGREE